MENHFALHHISDDVQRVRYAVSHMSGTALVWWMVAGPNSAAASSWSAFRQLFISQFQDINAIHQARARLAMLYQKNSVRNLVNDIQQLALDIPDITDSELLDKLMTKVKQEVGKHLVTLQPSPTTFREAADAAVRFDDLHHFYVTRSRQHPSAGATSQQYHTKKQSAGPSPMDLGAIGDSSEDPRSLPKFHPTKGPRCFNCNQYGHVASECRRQPSGRPAASGQRAKN
jgi:hypothetical protein